jgi:aspartyl/glutamyl-tRNA(Asn/Gln) amidotransferase C subunit
MTKDEIKNLGNLSRIALSENEIETFNQEIDSIIEYVSAIKDIVQDSEIPKIVGPRSNVFRADAVTNEPGEYTEAMLKAMSKTSGQYLSVKKILKQND